MKRLYALLLYLFPSSYRQEYGDELQAVFDLSLDDARKEGTWVILRLICRELSGLPRALIYEHLRQMRKVRMIKKLSAGLDFKPGSTWEALFALVPLFLAILFTSSVSLVFSYLREFSSDLENVFAYVLVGLFFVLLLLGFVKGFPRWSMPYLGILLALLSVYQFSVALYAYYGRYPIYERSWILGEFVNQAYLWSGLTLVVLLLVMASAIFPVFLKIRRDWTVLSFLVYGASPFAVLLAFDEYQLTDPYILVIFIVQVLGVWSYLHAHDKWKRFLNLFAALTLSMWIVAIGKVILLPSQTWTYALEAGWWKKELLGPVLMWIWLSVTMLIPLIIGTFPRVRNRAVIGSSV